jgi:hypothetical protein
MPVEVAVVQTLRVLGWVRQAAAMALLQRQAMQARLIQVVGLVGLVAQAQILALTADQAS